MEQVFTAERQCRNPKDHVRGVGRISEGAVFSSNVHAGKQPLVALVCREPVGIIGCLGPAVMMVVNPGSTVRCGPWTSTQLLVTLRHQDDIFRQPKAFS